MTKEVKKASTAKKKIHKKSTKFIWLGISIAVFAVGFLLCKFGVSFENYGLKAVYAVATLFPLLMAAQETSFERVNEDGKKNLLAYILYYFCIILFIVLLPVIFWVDQFVTI